MPQPEKEKSFVFDRQGNYRIRVEGLLDERWSERPGGMLITTSSLKDQRPVAELSGQVRDLRQESSILKQLQSLWTPVEDPAFIGIFIGVTTFYETIK